MKNISITEQRERVNTDFRRVGRPRVKWYNTTRGHIIKLLRKEDMINYQMARHEIKDYIIKATLDREI